MNSCHRANFQKWSQANRQLNFQQKVVAGNFQRIFTCPLWNVISSITSAPTISASLLYPEISDFFDFWIIKLNLYILFRSSTICKQAGNVAVLYCLHLLARFSKGKLGENNCRAFSLTFRYPPSSYLHFFAGAEGSKNHPWNGYLNCTCFCLCVCDMNILIYMRGKIFHSLGLLLDVAVYFHYFLS